MFFKFIFVLLIAKLRNTWHIGLPKDLCKSPAIHILLCLLEWK